MIVLKIKIILKKIIIVCVLLTSFSFVEAKPTYADIGEDLVQPAVSLVVTICDGILDVTHNVLLGQPKSIIRVNLKDDIGTAILRVAFAILIAAVVIVAVLATASVLPIRRGSCSWWIKDIFSSWSCKNRANLVYIYGCSRSPFWSGSIQCRILGRRHCDFTVILDLARRNIP